MSGAVRCSSLVGSSGTTIGRSWDQAMNGPDTTIMPIPA